MPEKYWFLKHCRLFEQLPQDELARLEATCRIRELPRKNPVYLPSDLADGVVLLGSGRVKICAFTPDGKQSILAFVEPGELFGELAIVGQPTREEYAETVEASTLVLIPATELQRLAQSSPDVSLAVTKLFGLRRQRIERRLKYLLFRSNRDRVIHLLLELADQYGRPMAQGTELRIRLSHQDLASLVGSTRETVTVVLGELQAEGLLKLGRQRIILRDLEGLSALADGLAVATGRSSPRTT